MRVEGGGFFRYDFCRKAVESWRLCVFRLKCDDADVAEEAVEGLMSNTGLAFSLSVGVERSRIEGLDFVLSDRGFVDSFKDRFSKLSMLL